MNTKSPNNDYIKYAGVDLSDMPDISELIAGSSHEHVGENIKHLRKLRGLTQKQLAKKMNVTQSAISQFESGGNLQSSTMIRLCNVLDVEYAFIYLPALYDETSPLHDSLEHIVKTFPRQEQLEQIFKVIEQRGKAEQRSKADTDSLSSLCMSIFNSLNDDGKNEAIKRIDELAQLDKYKKE